MLIGLIVSESYNYIQILMSKGAGGRGIYPVFDNCANICVIINATPFSGDVLETSQENLRATEALLELWL